MGGIYGTKVKKSVKNYLLLGIKSKIKLYKLRFYHIHLAFLCSFLSKCYPTYLKSGKFTA